LFQGNFLGKPVAAKELQSNQFFKVKPSVVRLVT
jgi:hypothetical protein